MELAKFHTLNKQDYVRYRQNSASDAPMLPLAKYHANTSEMLPFYPIHWHEEMEIIKICKGKCVVYVDGERYEASDGDMIILRPFVMHAVVRTGQQDAVIDAIVFNLRMLESEDADSSLKYFAPLLNDKHSVTCIVRQSDSWYNAFEQSFVAILLCNNRENGVEQDINTNLYRMFYHIFNNRLVNTPQNVSEDKRLRTVQLALEYIRAEYMKEITVEKIAKHCGYSEFYLMKLFKQFTYSSCVDYLNNYRLTVAGRQLRNTKDDVSTIAYQVGYNNVSYFNRQFKRLYGMTPRQFRAAQTRN